MIIYKEGKDKKIRVWSAWAEGDEVVVQHGILDGAQIVERKTAVAKNVGRSNALTAEQQAHAEVAQLYRKKLGKDYSETVEEAREGKHLPMLATKVNWAKVSYPVDAQPKLNGVRCLANHERLLSRGGKIYDIPHILAAVRACVPEDVELDGEIYIHGMSLQNINRLVKKHRPAVEDDLGSLALEYHVYDVVIPTWPWWRRVFRLKALSLKFPLEGPLCYVPYHSCASRGTVDQFFQRARINGFEGAILRFQEGLYELAHRSRNLVKVKEMQDAEFEIIGFDQGVGSAEGCVVWVCKTDKDLAFRCFHKGTREERRALYEIACMSRLHTKPLVGQMLTVQYQELTDDGIPQFPVGLSIRLPEDM